MAEMTKEKIDRGEAVNLAHAIVSGDDKPTERGIRMLADAVLRMDAALASLRTGEPTAEPVAWAFENFNKTVSNDSHLRTVSLKEMLGFERPLFFHPPRQVSEDRIREIAEEWSKNYDGGMLMAAACKFAITQALRESACKVEGK